MKFLSWQQKSLKQKIFFVAYFLIIFSIIIFFFILYCLKNSNSYSLIKSKKPNVQITVEGKLKIQTECPIDGVWTTPEKAFRHPLAISIENHPDSRPQSGLDKASLIFETPTEGGITRFLAFFVENDAEKIGPVRSARTYFLDWLSEFDGIFAHCGGNADALALINPYNIKDLDEFTYPKIYWRTYDRYAPHNLYTKTKNLWLEAEELGWNQKVNYQAWHFKDDIETGKRGTKQEIDIYYANPLFRVKYLYQPSENNYLRFIVDVPHIDKETQKQLSPKNVAVMWVKTWPLYDAENGWHIETIDSGPAKVFLDGKVISGFWRKEDRYKRTLFYEENGKEITFNRGQTWIQVVPEGTKVNY